MNLCVSQKSTCHDSCAIPNPQVLRLFGDLNKCEVISYNELRKKFRDKFISEDLLVAIIKKYNAFQADPQWQHLVAKNKPSSGVDADEDGIGVVVCACGLLVCFVIGARMFSCECMYE